MSLTIHTYPSHTRRRFRAFGVMVSMLLACLLTSGQALAAFVDEPVFDAPGYGQQNIPALPLFRGLTGTSTVVDVHIDGVATGRAAVSTDAQGKTQFTFVPLEPLRPGYHSIEAFASDPAGGKTARQSLWWLFQVTDPRPAPVLYGVHAEDGHIIVSGVVQSGFKVRVYVDGQVAFTSDVFVHASGARGFKVRFPIRAPGTYSVFATAVSESGVEGNSSDPLTVAVTAPSLPRASAPSSRPSPMPAPAPVPKRDTISQAPKSQLSPEKQGAVAGEEEQVVILPRISPASPEQRETGILADEATGTPDHAVPEAPETGAQDMQTTAAPALGERARLPLLIVLGILLVALIVWYATKPPDSGIGNDRGIPPPLPSSGGSRSGPEPSPPAPSPPPSPPPPPPAPNFAGRDEYE